MKPKQVRLSIMGGFLIQCCLLSPALAMNDPVQGRWLTRDPIGYVDSFNLFEALGSNPSYWLDPHGESVVSWLAKKGIKQTLKSSLKKWIKERIEEKLKGLLKRKCGKELLGEALDALAMLENSWWEFALDMVPIAGDVVGTYKFGKKVKKVFDKLDEIEEKVNKLIKKLRDKGVEKAWAKEKQILLEGKPGSRNWTKKQASDIKAGNVPVDSKGRPMEGHHKQGVKDHPELADDPNNIEFLTHEEHLEVEKKKRLGQ